MPVMSVAIMQAVNAYRAARAEGNHWRKAEAEARIASQRAGQALDVARNNLFAVLNAEPEWLGGQPKEDPIKAVVPEVTLAMTPSKARARRKKDK